MHLLEHLVDIDGVGLTPLLPSLLITLGDRLLSLTGFLGSFTRGFGRHYCDFNEITMPAQKNEIS